MIAVKGKIRKWGNSYGLALPVKEIKKSGLHEGQKVTALVQPKTNILKETFGAFKHKSDTSKVLREIDKELDSEF